jgi:hypothetical protein
VSEWWTYRPDDFLMFSPATYRRLFELYNAEWWPWQLLPLAAGTVVAVALGLPTRLPQRVLALVLASCWLWVAWAFHAQRYATINWGATAFAWAFALQGVLLAALATRLRLRDGPRGGALAMLVVALAWPALGLVLGRSWRDAEAFGFAPDPTAVATLAILLLARGPVAWTLRAVPLAWCVVGGTTLATMDDAHAWLLLGAAVASLPFGEKRDEPIR